MTGAPRDPSSREYYEESGYFQDGGAHLTDPGSPFHRYRIRMVLALSGPVRGLRVVDLGCGWGTISFALAREGASVVGVDFAEAAVEICRTRLEGEHLEDLTFLRADARDTGLAPGEWDLVVCADLVEHLMPDDTREVYREAWRLLRPGGRLVVWTPNPDHFLEVLRRRGVLKPDPTHVDYKTLERVVRELKEEGFEVEEALHRESHLPVLSGVERLFLRWVPFLRRRVGVRGRRPAP
jgi:2-polyprenyl-3-methyl-5-hydroxy-6-metoxy-1,4-benzoquinol methylase